MTDVLKMNAAEVTEDHKDLIEDHTTVNADSMDSIKEAYEDSLDKTTDAIKGDLEKFIKEKIQSTEYTSLSTDAEKLDFKKKEVTHFFSNLAKDFFGGIHGGSSAKAKEGDRFGIQQFVKAGTVQEGEYTGDEHYLYVGVTGVDNAFDKSVYRLDFGNDPETAYKEKEAFATDLFNIMVDKIEEETDESSVINEELADMKEELYVTTEDIEMTNTYKIIEDHKTQLMGSKDVELEKAAIEEIQSVGGFLGVDPKSLATVRQAMSVIPGGYSFMGIFGRINAGLNNLRFLISNHPLAKQGRENMKNQFAGITSIPGQIAALFRGESTTESDQSNPSGSSGATEQMADASESTPPAGGTTTDTPGDSPTSENAPTDAGAGDGGVAA